METKKKIFVLITHTLSEINVLFPLFSALKENFDFEINVIFTVKKIYRQYNEVAFYKYCEERLGLTTDLCHIPNKFDKNLEKLGSFRVGSIIRSLVFFFWSLVRLPNLITKLVLSDVYMHEFSNQIGNTRILYLFQTILRKRIFTYHHGNEISIDKTAASKIAWAEKSTILLFHHHNSKYMKELGRMRKKMD